MALTVIGQALSAQIVAVHHFQASAVMEGTLINDGLAQQEAEDLAVAWIAGQKAAYLACVASNYTMIMVRAQVIERPGNWRHRLTPTELSTSGTGTGNSASPASEAQTAAVLRWRTALAGKKFRGRTYLGPLPDGWQSAGQVAAGGQAAATAYKTAMLTAYGDAATPAPTWVLTIYSKPFNKGEYGYPKGQNPNREWFYPEEYAGAATNVTTGAVDPILRAQRRRQIGVGS